MQIDMSTILWHITCSGIIFLINFDKELDRSGVKRQEGHSLIFENAMD